MKLYILTKNGSWMVFNEVTDMDYNEHKNVLKFNYEGLKTQRRNKAVIINPDAYMINEDKKIK